MFVILRSFIDEHRFVLGGLAALGSALFIWDETFHRPKGSALCAGTRLMRIGFFLALCTLAIQFAVFLPLPYEPVDLTGKAFLITGCTPNGVGEAVARELLAWNASTVVCTMRTKEKAEALQAAMVGAGPGKLETVILELTSLDSVRTAAQEVRTRFPLLDGIMLNAGLMTNERRFTQDGFEEVFQVNHLSQFLFLTLLQDRLNRSARVSIVSSAGYFFLSSLDKEVYSKKPCSKDVKSGFSYFVTYGDTKLMNILTANAFARRLSASGIRVNSVCPGVVVSNFNNHMPQGFIEFWGGMVAPLFGRSPRDGALRPLYTLVNAEDTGRFYDSYVPLPLRQVNIENEEWLFETSRKLLGLDS